MKTKSPKYQIGSGSLKSFRTRDCLICRKSKRLHKNQYICDNCRKTQRNQGIL